MHYCFLFYIFYPVWSIENIPSVFSYGSAKILVPILFWGMERAGRKLKLAARYATYQA